MKLYYLLSVKLRRLSILTIFLLIGSAIASTSTNQANPVGKQPSLSLFSDTSIPVVSLNTKKDDATLQLDLSGTLYCKILASSQQQQLPLPLISTSAMPDTVTYTTGFDYDFSRQWYGIHKLRHILDVNFRRNNDLRRAESTALVQPDYYSIPLAQRNNNKWFPSKMRIQSEHNLSYKSLHENAVHASLYWNTAHTSITPVKTLHDGLFTRLQWSASGLVSLVAQIPFTKRLQYQAKVVSSRWQSSIGTVDSPSESTIPRRIPHVYDVYMQQQSTRTYPSWVPDLTIDTLGLFSCHKQHWIMRRNAVYGIRWYIRRQLVWPMSQQTIDPLTRMGLEVRIPFKTSSTYTPLDFDTTVRFETVWEAPKDAASVTVQQDFYDTDH